MKPLLAQGLSPHVYMEDCTVLDLTVAAWPAALTASQAVTALTSGC